MRQPYQVLVFPYRKTNEKYQYALFLREDLNIWQGIAGGVEHGENILDSAKREALEEANISNQAKFIMLDSYTMMPVTNVVKKFIWGDDVLLIKEYAFGVNAQKEKIKISFEHLKYSWFDYDKAQIMLLWDSNKTALWELNEKLRKGIIK